MRDTRNQVRSGATPATVRLQPSSPTEPLYMTRGSRKWARSMKMSREPSSLDCGWGRAVGMTRGKWVDWYPSWPQLYVSLSWPMGPAAAIPVCPPFCPSEPDSHPVSKCVVWANI